MILARWGRAVRARLWWWRAARLYLTLFVLALAAGRLLLVDAPLDLTP